MTLLVLFWPCFGKGQEVFINEFMAQNNSVIEDQDGEFSDWIEIFNGGLQSFSLHHWYLSDDANLPLKWQFPDVTLAPGGYLLIFASGKNHMDAFEVHTNFKIGADGEKLYLSNPDGVLIDQTEEVMLPGDHSYGRITDGADAWQDFFPSSPGFANGISQSLSFSATSGFFQNPLYFKVQPPFPGIIRFTRDGSKPLSTSPPFPDSLFLGYRSDEPNVLSLIPTSPDQSQISFHAWEPPAVRVDKAHVIRCAAFQGTIPVSPVYSFTFLIDSSMPDKYDLPVISLISDPAHFFDPESGLYVPGESFDPANPEWSGNYFQTNDSWDKPVYIEYFEKGGKTGFSQQAGIRIHGGKTRHAAQKSLTLIADDQYGNEYFHYPLFPQKAVQRFKRFVLSATMGSWAGETVIADVLAHEIIRDLHLEIQDFQPVVVFLNGEYWGIHTLRDKIDERYLAYVSALDENDIDLLDGPGFILAGNASSYQEVLDFMELHDMADPEAYAWVADHIDLGNFTDYQLAEIFFANNDWPGNNMKYWRPGPNGKWRWIFFDLDAGFQNPDQSTIVLATTDNPDIGWPNPPWSTFLLRKLLNNPGFRNQFVDRYAQLLSSVFHPDQTSQALKRVKALYRREMERHIQRWSYPSTFSSWEQDMEIFLHQYLQNRPCREKEHFLEFFGLNEFDFNCQPFSGPVGKWAVFPNPAKQNFTLFNRETIDFIGDIRITDITGVQIALLRNCQIRGIEGMELSLSSYPPGLYFLEGSGNGTHFHQKIMWMR